MRLGIFKGRLALFVFLTRAILMSSIFSMAYLNGYTGDDTIFLTSATLPVTVLCTSVFVLYIIKFQHFPAGERINHFKFWSWIAPLIVTTMPEYGLVIVNGLLGLLTITQLICFVVFFEATTAVFVVLFIFKLVLSKQAER